MLLTFLIPGILVNPVNCKNRTGPGFTKTCIVETRPWKTMTFLSSYCRFSALSQVGTRTCSAHKSHERKKKENPRSLNSMAPLLEYELKILTPRNVTPSTSLGPDLVPDENKD